MAVYFNISHFCKWQHFFKYSANGNKVPKITRLGAFGEWSTKSRTDPDSRIKRRRGPTKLANVENLPEGVKIIDKLDRFNRKFAIDGRANNWILHQLDGKLRQYKSKLKKGYYKPNLPMERALQTVPKTVAESQWATLVSYWYSEDSKDRSGRVRGMGPTIIPTNYYGGRFSNILGSSEGSSSSNVNGFISFIVSYLTEKYPEDNLISRLPPSVARVIPRQEISMDANAMEAKLNNFKLGYNDGIIGDATINGVVHGDDRSGSVSEVRVQVEEAGRRPGGGGGGGVRPPAKKQRVTQHLVRARRHATLHGHQPSSLRPSAPPAPCDPPPPPGSIHAAGCRCRCFSIVFSALSRRALWASTIARSSPYCLLSSATTETDDPSSFPAVAGNDDERKRSRRNSTDGWPKE
ncbi:hypothetical protein OsJ_28400 [Oryza sativa Japonica Group]|uniref:Uncharacterized protein n=1 Tax=Oryza sativa subsp. japonica TaxID=39947 RepID=B9G257_ORYSJ|nr:hypothetical protein OsJ_28400 [Oryza sativa Japonica Group]